MYGARAHRRSCVGDADSLLRLRIVSAALIIAWCNIAHFTGVSCTLRVRVSVRAVREWLRRARTLSATRPSATASSETQFLS